MVTAGLVGNSLVLHVYLFRFKPSVTRSYILAMAVCDLMSSSFCIPSDIVLLRFHYTFKLTSACKFIGAVRGFLVPLSGLLLVAVAIDRFRRVCQPTKPQMSQKCALLSIGVCAILALGHAVPNTIVRGPQTVTVGDTNITGVRCDIIGDEHVNTKFPSIFRVVTAALIIGCIVVMLVLYSLIGRHLWLHKRRLAATRVRTTSVTTDLQPVGAKDTSTKQSLSDHNDVVSAQHDEIAMNHRRQVSPPETAEWPVKTQDAPSAVVQEINSHPIHLTSSRQTENNSNIHGPGEASRVELCSPTASTNMEEVEPSSLTATVPVVPTPEGTRNVVGMKQDKSSQHGHSSRRRSSAKSLFSRQHSQTSSVGRPRSNSQVKQIPKRTTFMLFILTAVFVLSFIPQRIALAIYKDITALHHDDAWGLNLYSIAVRSWFINSAVNPFVYGFVSVQFRHECRNLFQSWRRSCCRRWNENKIKMSRV